jgi:hypothetical protein
VEGNNSWGPRRGYTMPYYELGWAVSLLPVVIVPALVVSLLVDISKILTIIVEMFASFIPVQKAFPDA